jgi:hypothetical protein
VTLGRGRQLKRKQMSKGKKRKPFGKSGMLEPGTHIIMNLGKRRYKMKSEQEKP